MTRTAIILVLAAAVLLPLAGCTTDRKPQVQAVFYPPPPDIPRLQFLTSFNNPDFWTVRKSSFADFVVGTEAAPVGEIVSPYGVAAYRGKMYICDLGAKAVHVIDMAGKSYGKLGTKDQIKHPVNITIAPDGTKYVCDTELAKVAVFDAQDRFVRHLGDAARCVPGDLALEGSNLVVVNLLAATVEIWSPTGELLKTVARKGTAPGDLRQPTNLAVNSAGEIFVSDTFGSIINVYDREGRYLRSIGAPGNRPGFHARPKGLAFDPQGNLFVADAQWSVIQAFAPAGHLLMFFGESGPEAWSLDMPAGLAFDSTSLEHFRPYVDKNFEMESILLVGNQFGRQKVLVYAFGNTAKAKAAAATRPARMPAAQPTTGPAVRPEDLRPPAGPPPLNQPVTQPAR